MKQPCQEELNKIREVVNKIEGLQAEDQEFREEAVTAQSYEAVESITGILSKVKAAGMKKKPDMHDTKSGLVYDLEALGHKLLVEAGAYWRSEVDDLKSTANFTADKARPIINRCIDSVSDAEAALLANMREADQEDQGSHEGQASQTDTARDREEYTVAFMHGVKCLAEDLAAGLPAGSGREALKSILKANYDYTDQDIERLFS